jgi:hypothetical protein
MKANIDIDIHPVMTQSVRKVISITQELKIIQPVIESHLLYDVHMVDGFIQMKELYPELSSDCDDIMTAYPDIDALWLRFEHLVSMVGEEADNMENYVLEISN